MTEKASCSLLDVKAGPLFYICIPKLKDHPSILNICAPKLKFVDEEIPSSHISVGSTKI